MMPDSSKRPFFEIKVDTRRSYRSNYNGFESSSGGGDLVSGVVVGFVILFACGALFLVCGGAILGLIYIFSHL
jgi:hypothetical protein